jgi:AraC-like DNA-binding protein
MRTVPDNYNSNIISTVLHDPVRVIDRHGGNVDDIFQRAKLNPDSAHDTIGLRKFVRFFEIASDSLRNPELGWEVGSEFDLRNMGALGDFIIGAPTLGAGLTLMSRSFAMVQSDSVLDLSVSGHEAVLSYRILDLSIWPRQHDVELTIAILLELLKKVAGKNWRPTRITFEHATSPIWKNPVLGPRCKVEYFAAQNTIAFPSSLLSLPMQDMGMESFFTMSNALTDESRRLERDAPVAIQVAREVVKRFGQGGLGQTEIAEHLGYSRRTLRRRLEIENRSFSGILGECRIRRAEQLLESRDLPLALIAEHLGYAEVAPFERAFRARKGVTPAQFRKQISAA